MNERNTAPQNNSVDVTELLKQLIANQNNNTNNKQNTSANEVIDLRELFFKYLKKWHWFAISITLCLVLAVLYLQTKNNEFSVSSSIMIRSEDSNGGIPQMDMLKSLGMMSGSKEVEDELYIMNSAHIMSQIIQNLDIQTTYHIKKGLRYEEQYPVPSLEVKFPTNFCDTLKKKVEIFVHKKNDKYNVIVEYNEKEIKEIDLENPSTPFSTSIGTLSLIEHQELEAGDKMRMKTLPLIITVESFRKTLSAAQVKKESNIISISTTSATPRKAIDMINELVRLYNLDAIIDKNIMASNTAQFIEERLQVVTGELMSVEMDVEKYMTQNKITNIEAETELYLETSSEYQKKIAEIETQLNLISYIQTHVSNKQNQFSLIPSNLGIEDQALVLLIQEYNKGLLDRMKLLRTTNEQNPVIIQLESELQVVRENIVSSINSLKDGINISKRDIISKDKQFEERIKSVPTQARQYIEIKRQQIIKETLYTYLYQKREENAVTLASAVQPAKTIDSAGYLPEPVSPKKLIILFIALILGGIIPIGILFIKDFLKDQIEDEEEYKKIVKAPITGYICTSNNNENIVVKEGSTSTIVELFRLVRTNLSFMIGNKKSPVTLITSTISGEGKSFVAGNIASSFALLKKKTVIIGLDIRNPRLSEYMHLPSKGLLTSYLSGDDISIEDIIIPSIDNEYLDVIPAGAIPPNPGELLLKEKLDELIAELRNRYDYIFIDSAPVGMVSDTFLLNRFADYTLYVSRANYTPRHLSEFINTTFANKRLNNMACVLNGVKMKTNFGYGYGYGYGHKSKTKD